MPSELVAVADVTPRPSDPQGTRPDRVDGLTASPYDGLRGAFPLVIMVDVDRCLEERHDHATG